MTDSSSRLTHRDGSTMSTVTPPTVKISSTRRRVNSNSPHRKRCWNETPSSSPLGDGEFACLERALNSIADLPHGRIFNQVFIPTNLAVRRATQHIVALWACQDLRL